MISWLKKRFPGQRWTWRAHIAIASLVPPFVAHSVCRAGWVAQEERLALAAIVSVFVLVGFKGHEIADLRNHAGRLTEPMDADGINPVVDGSGDINGPATATVCYWLALWLT